MMDLLRRRVLRGIVGGGAVTVALPLLNYYLNDNGDAFASGKPMPIRYGTWFWGLGLNQKISAAGTSTSKYELTEELAALKPVRNDINLITNLAAFKDGSAFCHFTGWAVARTGIAPVNGGQVLGESIDVTVANQIGLTTRFKHLTATATGDVRTVFSYENANTPNSPEYTPLSLYTRLFGPDFQDPNAPTFKPSPQVMIRKSALSGVYDQIKSVNQVVGAEDRARLDQYLTGIRHLEQQFDQQLRKPEPIAACRPAKEPKDDFKAGADVVLMGERHAVMSKLMAMAIACDQTRVFNMAYSNATANTSKAGYEKPHHTTTHEEPTDPQLGYQPTAAWFATRSMESWSNFVQAFAEIKEGAGRLIDNVLIVATTDVGYARIHSIDDMPAFTAGRAGGRIKSGLYIDAQKAGITSFGLTTMKVMGLDIPSWGGKSNRTSKEFGEILV